MSNGDEDFTCRPGSARVDQSNGRFPTKEAECEGMSEQVKLPTGETIEQVGDAEDFDTMMNALDALFHVAVCPNHSDDERQAAFQCARDAYIDFAYGGEDPEFEPEVIGVADASPPGNHERVLGDEDKQNAPSSRRVH
jgi:hypothetical protein